MPVYDHECSECFEISEHLLPHKLSEIPRNCPICGAKRSTRFCMPAPMIGTEIKRGDSRIIWSEKQVEAEHGKGWRDKGTTGKEGGAGKTLYFHD